MSLSTLYDLLTIGGGPSGLAAALSASRQIRRILIVDSREYRNLATTHMHNVVGFDHVPPSEFREKVLRDLRGRYGHDMVQLLQGRVNAVENRSDGEKTLFRVKAEGGEEWSARKIIVATGAKDVFPDIPGYAEAWGKSM
jgi:thioredoxin reductase